MDVKLFSELLSQYWPDLPSQKVDLVLRFYQLVLEGNLTQNLTRLTSPQDFLDGHVVDVRMLIESEMVIYPALDLGSGAGVPGLLGAILDDQEWILSDSEGRKAEFLRNCVAQLGLSSRVEVTSDRAEIFLKRRPVSSVVARAVGPLERVYGWLRSCSTWNNLVLFKGPKWEEEWTEFRAGSFKKELLLSDSHNYLVGAENKRRILVKLSRVPRGTIVTS